MSSVAFLTFKDLGACKMDECHLHWYAKLGVSAFAISGPLLFTAFHFFTFCFGLCN